MLILKVIVSSGKLFLKLAWGVACPYAFHICCREYVFYRCFVDICLGENIFETLLLRHDLDSLCILFRKPNTGNYFVYVCVGLGVGHLFWKLFCV